jgi:hypothetical protein
MYSLSLPSQQANAHLHCHVAPLPPGVLYYYYYYYYYYYHHHHQQEFSPLLKENGVLDVTNEAQAELANAATCDYSCGVSNDQVNLISQGSSGARQFYAGNILCREHSRKHVLGNSVGNSD